jgi:hypothetical protein
MAFPHQNSVCIPSLSKHTFPVHRTLPNFITLLIQDGAFNVCFIITSKIFIKNIMGKLAHLIPNYDLQT